MMGIETIREINRKATSAARRVKRQPWVPDADDRVKLASGRLVARFPFLADYVPPGWELKGTTRFVDTSGLGRDDAPALSQRQLALAIANDEPGLGYALIEHGQFQGYVASYKRR